MVIEPLAMSNGQIDSKILKIIILKEGKNRMLRYLLTTETEEKFINSVKMIQEGKLRKT